MASGQCEQLSELPPALRSVLESADRAVMATIDAEGRPHVVPVVFAIHGDDLVTPIDRKPKTGRTLGRRKNIHRDPHVTFMADKWSDEWTELAWVMVRGQASFQPPESSLAELELLVDRYPRYRDTLEASEVIRIVPERISWWSWA